MTEDIRQKNYRQLLYFFEEQIAVHFKLTSGEWRNGYIIDLSEEKHTLVLKEFIIGTIPILLEEIKENSIKEFNKK